MIVVNNSYLLAPWADVLYGADKHWWDHYKPEFSGLRYSTPDHDNKVTDLAEIIPSVNRSGLSEDATYLHQGSNSGYQAVNLAVNIGATRILLLGYDMKMKGTKRHWFGSHPDSLNQASSYKGFLECFSTMVWDLNDRDIEVINCSPDTDLKCFPIMELKEAI